MSDYRMLVLDLDGTALRHDGTLAEEDIAAAHRLKQAGVHVTINTGRLYGGAAWVAEALGIEGQVSVMNGLELVNVGTHHTVSGAYVDVDAKAQARRVFARHGLPTFLFGSRRIHYGREHHHLAPYLGIWTEDLLAHDDIHQAPHWDDADILAVCAAGDLGVIESAQAALSEELGEHLHLMAFDTFDGDRFVQLASSTWDKGTALEQLAQERGLRADQVVAVGDWINDGPMFATAGRAYAMNHAIDTLKERAHGVLDASREGGAVAEIAKKVWDL